MLEFKTVHSNYAIEYIINSLKNSSEYDKAEVKTFVSYLNELEEKDFSIVCWGSLCGWVAINYNFKDGPHAEVKRFCFQDACILEDFYSSSNSSMK